MSGAAVLVAEPCPAILHVCSVCLSLFFCLWSIARFAGTDHVEKTSWGQRGGYRINTTKFEGNKLHVGHALTNFAR